MNKLFKLLLLLLIPAALSVMLVSCEDPADKLTGSNPEGTAVDVSSRITGFGSTVTGGGAVLIINGNNLSNVKRVAIAGSWATNVEATESSVSCQVPTNVPLGMQDVNLVFGGNDRAKSSIEVVPQPSISILKPYSASNGETLTIVGNDLDIVEDVTVGGVSATVTSQSNNLLQFTMPSGSGGVVTLNSPAGNVNSEIEIVSCGAEPGNSYCRSSILLNGSLEEGDGDDFTNWGKWNGGAVMFATTVPSETYRGNRALKVNVDPEATGGTAQWRIQFVSDPNTTEIGASYTMSAWVKASIPGTTIRYSTQPSSQYQGDTSVGTNWTFIEWTFTANEASTRVLLDLNGPTVVTLLIDDISLSKN